MEKVKAIIKDEKEIFDDQELTLKELKMRYLKEKIVAYAEKDIVYLKLKNKIESPIKIRNWRHCMVDMKMFPMYCQTHRHGKKGKEIELKELIKLSMILS